MIKYTIENDLSVDEFKAVLIASSLGARRPIDKPDTLAQMVKHGNLIIVARDEGKIVGVSRSLTDFAYCTYLSDLAVDTNYQKEGIGKELIKRTKLAAPEAKIILLAAPDAIPYYPKIGMTQYEFCYFLNDLNLLK